MCFGFIFDILQNKLLNNTKTLLKEAAEREQRLLTENQDLKQRVGQRIGSLIELQLPDDKER